MSLSVRYTRIAPLAGAAIIAAAWLVGGPALAQDAPRQVGAWTLAKSADGRGCFLSRDYARTGGTTVLLGIDRDGSNRLTLLNPRWSIRPKDELKLNFRLSSGGYPKHFAIGIATDGKQGFVTSFEPKFPTYFAGSARLDVSRGDVPVERLALDGSGAAVAALRRCVEAVRAHSAAAAPVAERGDHIPADPFARDAKSRRRK